MYVGSSSTIAFRLEAIVQGIRVLLGDDLCLLELELRSRDHRLDLRAREAVGILVFAQLDAESFDHGVERTGAGRGDQPKVVGYLDRLGVDLLLEEKGSPVGLRQPSGQLVQLGDDRGRPRVELLQHVIAAERRNGYSSHCSGGGAELS